jgi:predicted patatin/cPLA2 family phospholipase
VKKTCIVLEGGGLRGAFTSGVLEYFLENNVSFDRVVGVSAGACVGASYISKQRGRNRKVNVEYPSDKRYMGFRHLITTGSYFNMKFVFEEIPNELVPFDEQAFYKNPSEFDVVATSLEDGQSVVFSRKDFKNISLNKALVASSSIPMLAKPVNIDGKLYFDGGVSDSIPVKYALSRHEKAVVVLTRPRGYRKEKLSNKLLYEVTFRKYPEFLKVLLSRNEEYNQTLDFCDQMEKEGKLFIIAPSPEFMIGRTEQNFEKRLNLYNHGYMLGSLEFEKMKAFLATECK